VFRFGGGVAENVAVSNCLLRQVFGCPIKFHGGPGSVFQNMSFSNLVLDEVTGPITLSLGPAAPRQNNASTQPKEYGEPVTQHAPAIARNIAFSNIHGTVTTDPPQLPDASVTSSYRPGEKHSCIALSAVGGAVMENISFADVHLTFGGGGTADDAARRDLPQIAGEYFALGPMPAYGFYARNCHGLTLSNVRLQFATPDLRPALILDHVTDAAIFGLNAQGHPDAESVCRFINTRDVLLTATRLLTPAAVFLRVEGPDNSGITLDGGDLSKAVKPVTIAGGADDSTVRLRL
jgi:hypothetical protein